LRLGDDLVRFLAGAGDNALRLLLRVGDRLGGLLAPVERAGNDGVQRYPGQPGAEGAGLSPAPVPQPSSRQ